jgi:hypothetical protein
VLFKECWIRKFETNYLLDYPITKQVTEQQPGLTENENNSTVRQQMHTMKLPLGMRNLDS